MSGCDDWGCINTTYQKLCAMTTVPYCCRSWGSESSSAIQRWEHSAKATWSGCIWSSHCPVNFNKSHKVPLHGLNWNNVLESSTLCSIHTCIDSCEPDLVGMQTRESFLAWQDSHSEEPWKKASTFQPQISSNPVIVEIPKSASSIGKWG